MNPFALIKDWYDSKIAAGTIQAGWYRSLALIGGWATSTVLLLPDALQIVVDHWNEVGAVVLPTVPLYWKAVILFVYVNFVAPPLRAWVQKKMQAIAIAQQAAAGKVVPLPASGVPAAPGDTLKAAVAEEAAFADPVKMAAAIERQQREPGPL